VLVHGDVVARRYRVARPLGRGGYGEVYEAERLDGGGSVALKLLHERHAHGGTTERRFEREAALAQRLQHPNIVRVLDFGRADDELPFIVFELLIGRTLRDEIAISGRLDPRRALAVTRQMLGALAYAHHAGVVHRDVKPANVFLCGPSDAPEALVKVLDFGIAKAVLGDTASTQLTATGQMLGTPQYMAPEQVRGEPVDARADVYAMGAVLAEMLSGQKLVPGETEIEVYMAHVSPQPFVLPPVAAESPFRWCIETAVRKRREDRYSNAQAMLAALEAIAGGRSPQPFLPATVDDPQLAQPSVAPPTPPAVVLANPSAASPAPRPERSRLWLVVGLIAGVIALGGTAAGVGYRLAAGSRPAAETEEEQPRDRKRSRPAEPTAPLDVPSVQQRLEKDGWRIQRRDGGDTTGVRWDTLLVTREPNTFATVTIYRHGSEEQAKRSADAMPLRSDMATRRVGLTVLLVGGDDPQQLADRIVAR
jgi:serine/threonine-protein kinase